MNITSMLKKYKDHKVEDMITDHKQSILILSGMKPPIEHQFQKKSKIIKTCRLVHENSLKNLY